MKKSPSKIIIYTRPDKVHGKTYFADVTGCFGGGYHGACAGDTPEEAALFALREKARYIDNNPAGGNMYLPAEVKEALKAATV
ncbi:MAG: hypothetical protein U1D67_08910 [Dehalococcoidia bacterium]|nr:hypothetical protein [Dehalococcoidia bacterium]